MIVADAGCVAIDGAAHADCVTVTVLPATASVPVRAAPLLGAIVNAVVPLPVPLAPDVIVIQALVVELDHAHDEPEVIAIELVPPAISNENEAGATL